VKAPWFMELIGAFGGRCVYCGGMRVLTVDHVVPKRRGGGGESNLLPACEPCNSAKGCLPFYVWLERIDLPLVTLVDRIEAARTRLGRIQSDAARVARRRLQRLITVMHWDASQLRMSKLKYGDR